MLQSLYIPLDQLQDGLMAQHEFDRMRYIVRKLFDLKLFNLKLQIHAIEAEPSLLLPADVIGHTIALVLDLYSGGILTRSLFVYVCTHLWRAAKDPHIQEIFSLPTLEQSPACACPWRE